MARPKSGDVKSDVIRFRCSPSERSAIAKGAAALGMTLSGYILFKLGVDAGEKIADVILDAASKSRDARANAARIKADEIH